MSAFLYKFLCDQGLFPLEVFSHKLQLQTPFFKFLHRYWVFGNFILCSELIFERNKLEAFFPLILCNAPSTSVCLASHKYPQASVTNQKKVLLCMSCPPLLHGLAFIFSQNEETGLISSTLARPPIPFYRDSRPAPQAPTICTSFDLFRIPLILFSPVAGDSITQ